MSLARPPVEGREDACQRWKALEHVFEGFGDGALVPFIRYVATLGKGYILPKSLYDYLLRPPRRRSAAHSAGRAGRLAQALAAAIPADDRPVP